MSCGSGVHRAFGLDSVRDGLSDVNGLSWWRTPSWSWPVAQRHPRPGDGRGGLHAPVFPGLPGGGGRIETGFDADLGVMPVGRSLAGDDLFALDSLLVSAERFIGPRRYVFRPHPLTARGYEPRRALPGSVTSIATVTRPSQVRAGRRNKENDHDRGRARQ